MASLHAIIITHTARHLRRTLLGVAAQSRRPDRTVLSCDTCDDAIRRLALEVSREADLDVTLVERMHVGRSRSAQVRNNAVRAMLSDYPDRDSRLVFLDGDCVPSRDAFAQHESLGAAAGRGAGGLVLGFRVDLTPQQTDAFSEELLLAGQTPVLLTPTQKQELEARHARYRRSLFLRPLGLTKRHKPKLLSANFSVPLSSYLDVNGFDEEYEGYGQEDDDFGLRCYLAGIRPVIGIADILVWHQHHPTRAPQAWSDSPGARRLRSVAGARCVHGVTNPLEQPAPTVERIERGIPIRPTERPA